jgi:hypothetical protein
MIFIGRRASSAAFAIGGRFYPKLAQASEQASAGRLRQGFSDGDLPPGTNVKELAVRGLFSK